MRSSCRAELAIVAALALALTACAAPTVRPTAASTTPAFSAVPVVSSDATPQTLAIGGAANATPAGAPADTLMIGGAAVDTWNGWLPDGQTFSPFDTGKQPVAQLDPLLLKAIQEAARVAQTQGVTIALTSGWRSEGFQERLFADAVRQFGSVEVAQQFVAAPETSRHVVGEAVDVTGTGVSDWLIRNGAQFGLCQIYANENWHFEIAVDQNGRCPPLRANAAG